MSETRTCGTCQGSGKYNGTTCQTCGGSGEVVAASKEQRKILGRRNAKHAKPKREPKHKR